jgi:hypothetical protein
MKKLSILLAAVVLPSCTNAPIQPPLPDSAILAYVHWEQYPSVGKKIELLETGESKLTDSTGHAAFSVAPGKYTLRAYGINRGGPVMQSYDFKVVATSADTADVDIGDCLPCL